MKFSFHALADGKLGISAKSGASLAESAEFCLYRNNHPDLVPLKLSGDNNRSGVLEWCSPGARTAARTYGDPQRAVEDGACAVAIVVVTQTEGYPGVMKASQGTGVDYWLTSDDDTNIFVARLEVSGILKGS